MYLSSGQIVGVILMMPAWPGSDVHAGDLDVLVSKLANDTWSWCGEEFKTAAGRHRRRARPNAEVTGSSRCHRPHLGQNTSRW